jgi:hypothetical protein
MNLSNSHGNGWPTSTSVSNLDGGNVDEEGIFTHSQTIILFQFSSFSISFFD